jgi:hypothetical protein
MRFIQGTAGYIKWDHKKEDISDKLKIKPVTDYIQNYERKWNMNTMNTERIPKEILCYQPKG